MKDKSYLTAIGRSRESAPSRWLRSKEFLNAESILDYGCGKGKDAEIIGMDKYDPHYHPKLKANKRYDVITSTYVLNVLPTVGAKLAVLRHIQQLLKPEGVAYITVRRDIRKDGYTTRGTWQENVVLPLYSMRKTSSYETYILKKDEIVAI